MTKKRSEKPRRVGHDGAYENPVTGDSFIARDVRTGGLNPMVDRSGHQVKGVDKSQ